MSRKTEQSDWKKTLNIITTIVIIIVPALIFGFVGKTAEMGLIVVASSITVAFLNIDKIKSFTGAGFKAEMKEAIDEANATMDNLKEVSIPLIVSALHHIINSGRLVGFDFKEREGLKNSLDVAMEKLGIEDEKINEMLEDFYRFTSWDLLSDFRNEFYKTRSNNDESYQKLQDMFKIYTTDYPSKKEILEVLDINDQDLNLSESEKLENYLYYIKKHKLR
ncbi:hypothetical protein OD350_29395 (plasmid) [Clostridium beijerinckii]|uniref:hypothetical protein n=1 Tax=Clostridium beijerinckii TaxID=1520 RepID=UPI002227A52F|nr:hypothetical protein [Clostridium beijerinckii]UYZ39005.1 hypothetical protein OD350_29395 [Clostridium beijerinckii]